MTSASDQSQEPERPRQESGWDGHRKGTVEYRRVLIGLFFAGVATFSQLYSPQAVLPLIDREFGVGAANAGLAISFATIGLAVGVVPWSMVADRLGRVRAMSIAVIAATIFGLIVPFSPSFGLLLAGRFMEGLMLGGVPAIAIAYLSEEVNKRYSAQAAGVFVAGNSIGGLSGRLIAGPVSDIGNWRIGVLIVAIVCAIAAACFIALIPEPQGFVPVSKRGFDPEGTLAHKIATNLRSPRLIAIYLQGMLLMGAFVAMYNYLGFRLELPPFDLPQTIVSLLFIAYLSGTWSSAQAGVIASRHGRLPVLVVSALLMTVGSLITLVGNIFVILIGLLIATTGFFAAHAIASGWTGAISRVGRAQASSLYTLFYYGGSSLFGWLGGVFFMRAGWAGTAGMVAVITAVSAGVALALLRKPRKVVPAPIAL